MPTVTLECLTPQPIPTVLDTEVDSKTGQVFHFPQSLAKMRVTQQGLTGLGLVRIMVARPGNVPNVIGMMFCALGSLPPYIACNFQHVGGAGTYQVTADIKTFSPAAEVQSAPLTVVVTPQA